MSIRYVIPSPRGDSFVTTFTLSPAFWLAGSIVSGSRAGRQALFAHLAKLLTIPHCKGVNVYPADRRQPRTTGLSRTCDIASVCGREWEERVPAEPSPYYGLVQKTHCLSCEDRAIRRRKKRPKMVFCKRRKWGAEREKRPLESGQSSGSWRN
jgi:hypothetical protein